MRQIGSRLIRILVSLGTLVLMFPVSTQPPQAATASAQTPPMPTTAVRNAAWNAPVEPALIQPFLTDVPYTPDPSLARRAMPRGMTEAAIAARERQNRGEILPADPSPPLRLAPVPPEGGDVGPRAPSQGTAAFQGAADTGFFPPDPVIAAGPNNIVVSANGVVNIFNKNGVTVSSQPLGGACPAAVGSPTPFFCTTDFIYDPWVVYDPYISRFWMLALSCNAPPAPPPPPPGTPPPPAPPACSGTPNRSTFQLALSDTSDASGTWRAFPFGASIGVATNWCDYEKIGFDAQAIYLTCNMFTFAGSVTQFSGVRVMPKAPFLSGPCCAAWDFWDLRDAQGSQTSFSVQPARMYGATAADGMFLVNAHGGGAGGNRLEVWRFTNVGVCCAVAPTLAQTNVAVRAFNRPPDARQPGSNNTCNTAAAGTFCVDTGDSRLLFAVWQGGLLSTGHTSSCASGPATSDSCLDFIELNVASYPTITTVNDWELAAPGRSYYFPSVDVNAAGNKTMVYSRSSTTENPSTYFLGIPSSATCTNCQDGPETLLLAGTATYVDCGLPTTACAGTLRNRWGDYFGAARDPDGVGIWIVGEASVAGNNWSVQVGHTYGTPPPNNDNFVQAAPVTALPAQFGGNTATATVQAGEPRDCRSFQDTAKTVWYQYTPPVAMTLDVDTSGSSFDSMLGVYTGAAVNPAVNALTRTACNDDFGTGRQSRLTFPAAAGTTYFIQVGGNNAGGAAASGNVVLNIRQAPAAPANDNFAQATILPALPATFTVDTISATTEGGEQDACGPNPLSHTVWYRFTPVATVLVDVDTRNSDFDTVLKVYTGNAVNALSNVTCNDNFGSGLQSSLFFTAQAGVTYYIQVGGIAGAVGGRDHPFGNLRLNVGAFPPANDNLVNLVNPPTSLPATFTVGTTYASTQAGEPLTCNARSLGKTVWYRFTPSTNLQLQIETLGSDFDTVLSVYTGSAVNALTPVICNDDSTGGLHSRVLFAATAGTTYQVQVGGGNGASGNLAIRFSQGLATNDLFSQATAVTAGTTTWLTDVNTAATTEPGEPLSCDGVAFGRTVWYRFTPAATTSMEIDTTFSLSGATFLDTVLGVYTGTEVGALTPVICNDQGPTNTPSAGVKFVASPGTTYYAQVGSKAGASGTLTVKFTLHAGTNNAAAQATVVGTLPAAFIQAGGAAVWYRYTAATTIPMTVDTIGSSSSGTLTIFSGTPQALTQVLSSNDVAILGGRNMVFTVPAGSTYFVRVTGVSGTLAINFTPGGTIELASQSAWEWFNSDPGPGQAFGNGFALQVCLDAPPPQPCPMGGQPWGTPGGGWNADLSTLPPAARWIWRDGVTRFTFPADLQQYYFSRTFQVGVPPTSAILRVAADDLAEVRVNGVSVGTVGSITNRANALAAQNALQSFDIAPFLVVGTNRVTLRAQNGPSSFGSACGGGCNYQLNPAGVVFGASIRLDADVIVPPPTPTPIATRTPVPPPGPEGAWAGLPPADPLVPRFGQAAVWAGANMVIWGGAGVGGALADGARYSPVAKGWGALAPAPLSGRVGHTGVWTGAEVLFWGGGVPIGPLGSVGARGALADGARYRPGFDTWSLLAAKNAPSPRSGHTAVWTGTEMFIWGGTGPGGPLDDGARYDPSTDTWNPLPSAPLPGRFAHTAVWTGTAMVVWGGSNGTADFGDGASYNPSTNTWTSLSLIAAPTARQRHTAIWTGSEMLVWGGSAKGAPVNDGARFDPGKNAWNALPPAPLGPRFGHTAVWTGTDQVIWGGTDGTGVLADGARFSTGKGWTLLPPLGAPSARSDHSAVWTGGEMLVWGGATGIPGKVPLGDGFGYTLPLGAAPTPTGTPQPVAGRGFTLQSGVTVPPQNGIVRRAAVDRTMFWQPGSLTSALMLRWSPESDFSFLPSPTSPLPPGANSFVDTDALQDPVYCYVLLAFAGELAKLDVRGLSDLLCIYVGTNKGSTPPVRFRAQLNDSQTATLRWEAPGGQTRYVLTANRFDGSDPRVFPLLGLETSFVENVGDLSTCYQLEAFSGATSLGVADTLCTIPGISSFVGGATNLNQALTRLRSVLERSRPR